jgi:hypothetical protein
MRFLTDGYVVKMVTVMGSRWLCSSGSAATPCPQPLSSHAFMSEQVQLEIDAISDD